ncbi:hypothetical protein EDF56_107151 [Novosphingobium sp. PhB165]|nr:hypothetical protein EDF56_107151 [Novosphingobium sp. PhB165]
MAYRNKTHSSRIIVLRLTSRQLSRYEVMGVTPSAFHALMMNCKGQKVDDT